MNHPLRTRREVLAGGLAGAAGLMLASCSNKTLHHALNTKPAGSDLGAIEHVVFLMMENRSFDHYFGAYPKVRGFDDRPGGHLGAFSQPWGSQSLLPFRLDTTNPSVKAECTTDLSHAWTAQHQSWHNGAMDRFVATHTSK